MSEATPEHDNQAKVTVERVFPEGLGYGEGRIAIDKWMSETAQELAIAAQAEPSLGSAD